MLCDEARSLFESDTAALEAFHRAQEPLATGITANANLAQARVARQEAFANLARARGKYWKHVQMHGCRAAAVKSDPEIRSVLERELTDAKEALRAASYEFDRMVQISAACLGVNYSDGKLAIDQARAVYAASFRL